MENLLKIFSVLEFFSYRSQAATVAFSHLLCYSAREKFSRCGEFASGMRKGGLGMDFLLALQSIRTPFLNVLTLAGTWLGSEAVFLVLAVLCLWCLDKRCGYYMAATGLLGITVGQFLKIACRIPRPWIRDPNLHPVEGAVADAGGYSFPSGHSQTSTAALLAPAVYRRRTALIVLASVLCLFTAFTRMYLGVHTPADVAAGLAIGVAALLLLLPIFRRAEEKPQGIAWVFAGLCVLSLLYVLYMELHPFPSDVDADNFQSAWKNSYLCLFSSLAFLLSYVLDLRNIHYPTSAVWWAQILKAGIGIAGVLALRVFLKAPLLALFGGHPVADGLRYFLMVFFGGTVWPLTFRWFSRLGRRAGVSSGT